MKLGDLARRIDVIEDRMDTIEQRLDASYAALMSQILQSRREAHDELLETTARLETRLEAKIEASADETRRFMKVLYEDILSRIALLGESRQPL